jgi:pimeloyl-ACP methyl ester carboxylesterase
MSTTITSRRWPVALVLAVLLLLLPACTTTVQRNSALVKFAACPAELAVRLAEFAPALAPKIDLACGELAVPLDYARPEGEQITLKIIRARHQEQSDRIGSLIFNPGGPGDPGLEYVPFLLSWVPEVALQRFDLVSLDPRGTGGSAPINCPAVPDDPAATTPNVLTEAGFAETARIERQYNQACMAVLSSRAPHFTTQAAARDIDRLRAAVGDETLTYLGGSYRAKLGAEYAHQFPSSVRAAVLDGPSEPSATLFDSIVRQTNGFEDGFDQYAKGCASRLTCQLSDPQAFVARLVARADVTPIPSRRSGDDGSADGNDVLEAVRAALSAEERWPDLDEILYETSEFGNSGGVFAMIENVYGPRVADSAPADHADANYVINCNDSAVGPTDEQIRATARAMARDYPLFGAHAASNLFGCKTWQPQRSVLESPVAPTPNPLLVIGTIHDSTTPYVGAVALTKALGNATLLTWDGNNHTAMGYSTCIADTAARYLIDLTLPPADTHCPP